MIGLKLYSEQASTPDSCSSPFGSRHTTLEELYLILYIYLCWCIWLPSQSERVRAGSGTSATAEWSHVDRTAWRPFPTVHWGWLLSTEDPSCSTSVSPHVALLVDVIVFPQATGSLSSRPEKKDLTDTPLDPVQVPRACKLHHRISTWEAESWWAHDCPSFRQ